MTDEESKYNPDYLRMPKDMFRPHPFSEQLGTRDSVTGNTRKNTFEDAYQAISQIKLNSCVPEDVNLSFETAKNLFLYGWYIYRFYAIADHQVLNCLEFGLRKRFENEFPNKRAGLKVYLNHAINCGLVKSEGFRNWRDQSRDKIEEEQIIKTSDEPIRNIEAKYLDLDYEQDKAKWDYLSFLLKIRPRDKKLFAHDPSKAHSPSVLRFVIVSEILNQIFPA